VAVFNPAARPGKKVAEFCEQFFGFLSKKTSAVKSSSHAPSRASGRLYRGAAHFLVARTASVGFDIADCFKQSTQNLAVGEKRNPSHRNR